MRLAVAWLGTSYFVWLVQTGYIVVTRGVRETGIIDLPWLSTVAFLLSPFGFLGLLAGNVSLIGYSLVAGNLPSWLLLKDYFIILPVFVIVFWLLSRRGQEQTAA